MSRATRVGVGIAGAGAALGLWADILFRGRPLGLNVLLWTLAFTAALAFLLRLARVPLHQGRRRMLAPLLVFSAAFLWRDSALLVAVNLLAVQGPSRSAPSDARARASSGPPSPTTPPVRLPQAPRPPPAPSISSTRTSTGTT